MKNIFYILIFIILTGGFITSCKDDSYPDEPSVITFSESAVEVKSKGRYYTVKVNASDSVSVSCHSDWIELESTTVKNDGRLVFYIKENEEKESRKTVIQVTTFNAPVATADLTVTQSGVIYDGSNTLSSESLGKDFRVGWGYDICMDFMSDKSIMKPILDYNKLQLLEKEYGDEIIGESNRSVEQMDTYTAYSLAEMARQLTSVQDSESSFLGLAKTVTRHVKIVKKNTRESQVYGYVRASKIVATRYIDEGKLDDLVKTGADIFDAEFDMMRRLVLKDPSDNNINRLIDRFGTHLVVLSDIGGAIDYSINFQASKVTDLEQSVITVAQYSLGRKTLDENTKKEISAKSSVIDSELAITVMGGDKKIVESLKNSIVQLNEYSQLDAGLLSGWINSVNNSSYWTEEGCKNLTVVKCKTLPIWELFTDDHIRSKLKRIILDRADKTTFTWSLEDFGIVQTLEIPLNDRILSFVPSDTSSLVRLGYVDKEPKVEICNEYVPEIRSDQRVTILYPIHFGMSNIRRGIYPGDGQGSPPAYVICTPEGKAYIRPIAGYKRNEKLTKVYYLGGTLYPEPNDTKVKLVSLLVQDEKLFLMGMKNISYPLVKIGNGYWTRKYIQNKLGFGQEIISGKPNSGYRYKERIYNNMLYAIFFYGNDPQYVNTKVFGSESGLWYLPTSDDLSNLMNTIGKNPKALFRGQVSGFDAEFKGYYGFYDIRSGTVQDSYKLRDDNFSFIGFKDSSIDGSILAIGADYKLDTIHAKVVHNNYYPIRLFRKSNFIYPNK